MLDYLYLRNPMIDEIITHNEGLVVLNKADMADDRLTKQWIAYFDERGQKAISINAQAGQMKKLQQLVKCLSKKNSIKWLLKALDQEQLVL